MSDFLPFTVAGASGDVTYKPTLIDSAGVAKWLEVSSGSLESRRTYTQSYRPPKVGGSVTRVTAKLVIPVMDGSTPPVKIGECIVNAEYILPKTATATHLQDLQEEFGAISSNVMEGVDPADSPLVTSVKELEGVY